MKLKQQLKKALIAVFIILAFFIFMNYFQKKEAVVAVDPDKFSIVDSEKEMDEKFAKVVPGYNLASQYDLVKNYDLEYPIIEANRTLRIEKAWLFMERLFVVYSFDLKKSDDDPKEIPSLAIEAVTYEIAEGEPKTITVNNELSPEHFYNIEKGFVYNNRIYKGKFFFIEDIYNNEIYQKLLNGVEVESIKLNTPTLTVEKEDTKDTVYPIGDISLNLNYNFKDSDTLDKIKIDQETKLANGDIIHWEEFHIGINNNYIYYTVEPKDAKIKKFNLELELPSGKQEENYMRYRERSYHVSFNQTGKAFLYMPPFEEVPKYIELKFMSAEYTGDESVEFTIPGQDIEAFLKQKDDGKMYEPKEKEIGKTKDYLFTYGGLLMNNANSLDDSSIKIGVSPTKANNNKAFGIYFVSNQEYEANLQRAKEDTQNSFFQYWLNMSGPIIKIANEKGKELTMDGTYTVPDGFTQYQNIIFKDEVLRNAKQLNVKIFNIPQLVEILDSKSIKIDLK